MCKLSGGQCCVILVDHLRDALEGDGRLVVASKSTMVGVAGFGRLRRTPSGRSMNSKDLRLAEELR